MAKLQLLWEWRKGGTDQLWEREREREIKVRRRRRIRNWCFVATRAERFLAVLRCVQQFDLKEVWFCERSQSIYRLKDKKKIEVYPTQQGPDEDPKAFNLSLIIGFELSVCPLWKKRMLEGWECCLVKMLFFKSRLGLFGMDLGFIVGLSFVRKLMPLCPLAHKSPDFFSLLLYFTLNLRAQPFQITK